MKVYYSKRAFSISLSGTLGDTGIIVMLEASDFDELNIVSTLIRGDENRLCHFTCETIAQVLTSYVGF